DGINILFGKGPFGRLRDRGSPVWSVKESTKMKLRIREVDFKAGAKFKGLNGGVAVGLPHRNSSIFKQAHIINMK
ncbi:MAG: hypothetical protein WCJ06_03885, partial [Planctomycetota bacterium]